MYDGEYYPSLQAWQADTPYDDASIAAPDTPCAFVDAPVDAADDAFNVDIASGECLTAATDGGKVGACALGCAGAFCEACGGTPPEMPSTSGAGGGVTTGAGTGSGSGTASTGTGSGDGTGGASDGATDGGDAGGCSCSTASRGGPASFLAAVAALLAMSARRRSRR